MAAAAHFIPGGMQTIDGLDGRNLHRDLPEAWVRSACGECLSACPVLLRRIGGKIVGIRPSDRPPCLKAYVLPQELVHPDRITSALRKDGNRGSGRWRHVELQEALEGLSIALADSRPRIALVTREDSGLSFAVLQGLFAALDAKFLAVYEWPNHQPPVDALREATGWEDWRYDVSAAAGVVSFGWDWLQTYPSPPAAQEAWLRARRRGLPTVYVGPRLNLTAMRSREWIACRPGMEPLVALTMSRLLRDEGDVDLEETARRTGVPARKLESLAQELRERRLLCIAPRGRLPDQRAVVSLNEILGHFGQPGGLLSQPKASLPLKATLEPVEGLPAAIEQGEVETVVLAGINPVFDSPEPRRWVSALRKARHVICLSTYLDETAAFGDWVLPLGVPAERREIFLDVQDGKVVPREVEPAVSSQRVGPEGVAFFLADHLNVSGFPWKTLDEVAKSVKVESPPPFSWRRLPSNWDSPEFTAGDMYLLLETPAALAHGHGAQHPYLLTTVGPHLREWWTTWVELNPAAAERYRIRDREWVRLESESGAIEACARISSGVPEDTVCLPAGLGHLGGTFAQERGGNAAELVPFRQDAATGLALWNHVKLRIRKV